MTKFSQALFNTICERIANGESLRAICADSDMPDKATVLRWLQPETAAALNPFTASTPTASPSTAIARPVHAAAGFSFQAMVTIWPTSMRNFWSNSMMGNRPSSMRRIIEFPA